ncbi:transposase [Kocuria rhizophila]
MTIPSSQQIPEDGPNVLPRVLHTPRSRALLSESRAQAEEAKREEWAGNDSQLPYEAYAAGEPCRACGRALLGEPALGTDEESIALIDADNAEFRAEHEACNMGVWRLAGNRVEHCHLCTPFPPLSPTQRDEFRQLLHPSSLRIDRSAVWRVELTCQHVETLAGHAANYVESTVQCTNCAVIRGVVKAVRIDDQAKNDAGSSTVDRLQPGYQRLTDEQWSWIKHIVQAEEGPRRGRPRTDIRTIVDAALYKTRTGITWRELPAAFGPWQTALRRHPELIASSQWEEITRTVAERDLPR